jgi:hypothetical protein
MTQQQLDNDKDHVVVVLLLLPALQAAILIFTNHRSHNAESGTASHHGAGTEACSTYNHKETNEKPGGKSAYFSYPSQV